MFVLTSKKRLFKLFVEEHSAIIFSRLINILHFANHGYIFISYLILCQHSLKDYSDSDILIYEEMQYTYHLEINKYCLTYPLTYPTMSIVLH